MDCLDGGLLLWGYVFSNDGGGKARGDRYVPRLQRNAVACGKSYGVALLWRKAKPKQYNRYPFCVCRVGVVKILRGEFLPFFVSFKILWRNLPFLRTERHCNYACFKL